MATAKPSTDRAALMASLALIRPALASAAYIPALTHIRFAGGWATAYNDTSAIEVRADIGFECCIPGDMLIRTLGSFSGDQVTVQPSGEDNGVIVSSGRSKIKMPTLVVSAFPFTLPPEPGISVSMGVEVLAAVKRCLISVGTNDKHPAQMGVTMEADERGRAVFFSTDNYTISRCQTKAAVTLPGGTPVIMPTFFCEQMLALAKAFPDAPVTMDLLPGCLIVEVKDKATLFTRMPVDLEPMDFPGIIARHCKVAGIKEDMAPIPDVMDAALGRALLVLSGEADKRMRVTISDAALILQSDCQMGSARDDIDFEAPPDGNLDIFYVDPGLLARGCKACALIGFLPRAVVLADADATFVHLVAHSTPPKDAAK